MEGFPGGISPSAGPPGTRLAFQGSRKRKTPWAARQRFVVGLLPDNAREGDAAAAGILMEKDVFVILVEFPEIRVQREEAGEDFLPGLVVIAVELAVQAVENGLSSSEKAKI